MPIQSSINPTPFWEVLSVLGPLHEALELLRAGDDCSVAPPGSVAISSPLRNLGCPSSIARALPDAFRMRSADPVAMLKG